MPSRVTRALRRMTDSSTTQWWRPQGFDMLVAMPAADALTAPDDDVRRDGSSADLRGRQRELAFDMYAEALVRLAHEDEAAYRKDERASA